MIIYGSGMAGLLAANMLRRFQPEVREMQKELPDNHGALLRFRSDAVERVTGQPFKRVMVHKAVKHDGELRTEANLKIANLYSRKVTGAAMSRSVMNLAPGERYIAPPDFISTMAQDVNILFNTPVTGGDIYNQEFKDRPPIISTIPMPTMMDLVGWNEKPEFRWLPIWSFRAKIADPVTDVYQTIYYPDGDTCYYRASITGDQLIVEYIDEVGVGEGISDAYHNVCKDFGIDFPELIEPSVKYQHYGKLLPIDDRARRSFIMALSNEYGIYSLGRFATWRQLLMDDVVNDVQVVERFITDRDQYSRHLHYS